MWLARCSVIIDTTFKRVLRVYFRQIFANTKVMLMCSNLVTSLKWWVCWSSVAGCRENPHAEKYRLLCHFYKTIQCGTFGTVSFENQPDRLLSYLVTASKEYEEEEYEENGRFRRSFIGSRNVFVCLQGQFTA